MDKEKLQNMAQDNSDKQMAIVYQPPFQEPTVIHVADIGSDFEASLYSSIKVNFYLSERNSLSENVFCHGKFSEPVRYRGFGEDEDEDEGEFYICIQKDSVLRKDNVISFAKAAFDDYDEPVVQLTIDNEQAKILRKVTSENVGETMAILLTKTDIEKNKISEEYVISNPVIREAIGKYFVISGNFTGAEAKELARQINAGIRQINEMTIIGFDLDNENSQKLAQHMNASIEKPLRTWFKEKWRPLQCWRHQKASPLLESWLAPAVYTWF